MTMMINSLKIVKMFGRIGKISRTRKYCSNSKSQQPIKFLSSTACDSKEPPELPSTCCMSGNPLFLEGKDIGKYLD